MTAAAEAQAAERERLAAERAAAEQARRAQEEAIAREQRLDVLARRGEGNWQEVEALINLRRPDEYDRAVGQLKDLRALAERQ